MGLPHDYAERQQFWLSCRGAKQPSTIPRAKITCMGVKDLVDDGDNLCKVEWGTRSALAFTIHGPMGSSNTEPRLAP